MGSEAPQGPIVLPKSLETSDKGEAVGTYVRALQENAEKDNGGNKESLKSQWDIEKELVGG